MRVPDAVVHMKRDEYALIADGTLADTQRVWSVANADVLRKYGIVVSLEEMTEMASGVSALDWLPPLARKHGKVVDVEGVIGECVAGFESLCVDAREMPGATELVRSVHGAGIPLGIASGSLPHLITKILVNLALERYFAAIVTNSDVPRGKPAPDVFLLAAERLHIDPRRCVVIEDGKAGMVGARAAGMKCIGYVPDRNGADYPADIVVRSLSEVTPDLIYRLAH
jgi:beta-phosphoglucomutase-like phosphatase (HAD superfamily)